MKLRSLSSGLGLALCLLQPAVAQVRCVTLGIRTHCPYGIRGCWAEIRDGLQRPEPILSIAREPDQRTDTCEVRMRDKWTPDPDMFARNFTNMHIGVDVRGVEATVDGLIGRSGTNLLLRLPGSDTAIFLTPLTRKVQWDPERKQPQAATRAESKAFEKLAARFTGAGLPMRVVGPLRSVAAAGNKRLVLEVRSFEPLKSVVATAGDR
jgi:hypothetical protein